MRLLDGLADTAAVVVTDGPALAHWLDPKTRISVRPDVVRAVDSNGAGDVFSAGCILGIMAQLSPQVALPFAAAAAALKCQRIGNSELPSLSDLDDLERWARDNTDVVEMESI